MATLYELTGEWLDLYQMMDDPEVPSDVLLDTIESIDMEIDDKLEKYGFIVKQLDADEKMLLDEMDRLNSRLKSIRNNRDRVKQTAFNTMKAIDKPKIKTTLISLSIAKNGGKQPMSITSEVPEEYLIYKPEADKEKIRKELEAGKQLDFAELLPRGEHLNIR